MTETQRVEQCRSALALANEVRAENALLKRELKRLDSLDSHAKAIVVLEDFDGTQPIGSLRVNQLVLSVRGVGPARAGKWLSRLSISQGRRVRELSFRQLQGLVSELEASQTRIRRSRYGS